MDYRYLIYENGKLYRKIPKKHELEYLTAGNLNLLISSARYKIRQTNKKNDFTLMQNIYNEIEEIYYKLSVKNKTSIRLFEAFELFVSKQTTFVITNIDKERLKWQMTLRLKI